MQLAGILARKPASKSAGKPPEMGEIIKFSEKGGFDYGLVFIALSVVIAVGATFLFWWMNRNLTNVLAERRAEKDSVIQEITSPTYRQVEKRASDFKDAISELKSAAAKRYAMTEFLPELFKYVTDDVQISNLTFNTDDVLTLTGTTQSYRSIAELMMSLQSWNVLSGVALQSFGVGDSNSAGTPKASFVITASVDTKQNIKSTTGSTATDTTTDSGVGSTESSIDGLSPFGTDSNL